MSISLAQIDAVRAFNRDYTRRIGVLSEGLLDSPFSLTEVRVLYEIAHRPGITAAELSQELGLDRGYLSRILQRFAARRLLSRDASAADARRRPMRLTAGGRRLFAPLERRSQQQVRTMLAGLDDVRRRAVLEGMAAIHGAFEAQRAAAPEVLLRGHAPGDMGWVVERHGSLYAQEYGWTQEFEALVAQITAEFIRRYDPARERCWIAESGGRRVGSIFLVAGRGSTARLRLLLVDPQARGCGVGRRLIAECVQFARSAGYRRIRLWTQQNLTVARHLYQQAGFRCTAQRPHHSFGHELIGETWELRL